MLLLGFGLLLLTFRAYAFFADVPLRPIDHVFTFLGGLFVLVALVDAHRRHNRS